MSSFIIHVVLQQTWGTSLWSSTHFPRWASRSENQPSPSMFQKRLFRRGETWAGPWYFRQGMDGWMLRFEGGYVLGGYGTGEWMGPMEGRTGHVGI